MQNNFEGTICPACGIIDRFGDKWSLRILVLLHTEGTLRFNEILKRIPNISQRMLSISLKSLEADKLVSRKIYPEVPPKVEYTLTSLGKSLIPPLEGLIDWALDHAEEITKHREKFGKE
ncbi:winged helix-turn-helix transcriptional regulator [Porphyromonas circumdentaria]|uniref:Transcriptional regulator, HxlR family n=1 Tax=Porphyromonas circumdentaria TaxID=29524 RepID=A0A1T4PQU2_9PORP|nr:helix-turn-helix domain-containing protein [Porphyromonas circumdentaria]MBB6276464.1 DNA-binding HxlR family transcriptional regulator [Porphyromonas circumdentaria]MDO4722948.1 helix-turn-helix domain-containing protein [Porphyromonas circumdentaria]SJZ93930.1 transcriptional regulator, HxlR family [Porphyromonas circumdentaria]